MRSSSILLVLLLYNTLPSTSGKRFATSGPVLTVTVKDPTRSSSSSTKSSSSSTSRDNDDPLAALAPSLVYNVVSTQPPLPAWLPSLKSLGCSLGYRYTDLKRLPSYLESTAKFELPFKANALAGIQLRVQPSHELATGTTSLLVQASRGAQYAFMSFSKQKRRSPALAGSASAASRSAISSPLQLDLVRASVMFSHLPFASLSTLRITPVVNVAQRDVACQIEAVTGPTTKAILNLEYERPSLAVLYQTPDARNLLRPEIDLYSGKIVYQWITALQGGGSVSVKVDPVRAISATWTDYSRGGAAAAGSGTWVTDVTVPLAETNTLRNLQASVKVRRQFQF